MYIGSVRFYKHIIVLVLSTVILLLVINILVLKAKYMNLEKALGNESAIAASNKQSSKNNSFVQHNQEKNSMSYQNDYPELYADRTKIVKRETDKVVYLTFDDGPSDRTLEILDILDQYNIKATFFVIYKDDEKSKDIYREIVKRGHTIAIHSASHSYQLIYKSMDDYLQDFNKLYKQIETVTGIKVQLFRFPGGSINPYDLNIYQQISAEMLRRGFIYFDWNVSGADSAPEVSTNSIYNTVVENVQKNNKAVVLLHDSEYKTSTVAALDKIIPDLQDSGYTFDKLDGSVTAITFTYINY